MRYFNIIILVLMLTIPLAAQTIHVGVAVRDITPDPLLPVSGGVGVPKPAHKKQGNLTIRAIVFKQKDIKVAIVGIDNLGWPAVLGDESRKLIPEIAPENILIGATHTHSAPDVYGFPDENGHSNADPEYLSYCIKQIADAVHEALKNVQPAYLKIAVGEARGKIAFNYYAPELYDPRCGIIQAIDSKNQKVIGTLVNYAIHPEVIGSKQGILSPDLCGPLYDQLESKTGGVAIFMNGAQGGMVTADNRRPDNQEARTWEECQRIGRLLANEALRILDTAELQQNPVLDIHTRKTIFPVTSPLMKQLMEITSIGAQNEEGFSVTSNIVLLDIGSARILTIPGEALPNIGYYLKRKMGTTHPFLFGLTNDAYGYILTKEDFDSFDRYEYISKTSLGEQTGEILIEACEKLMNDHPRKSQ